MEVVDVLGKNRRSGYVRIILPRCLEITPPRKQQFDSKEFVHLRFAKKMPHSLTVSADQMRDLVQNDKPCAKVLKDDCNGMPIGIEGNFQLRIYTRVSEVANERRFPITHSIGRR